MEPSTLKRWHVVSLLCAATMPGSSRFGIYADEQNPGNG